MQRARVLVCLSFGLLGLAAAAADVPPALTRIDSRPAEARLRPASAIPWSGEELTPAGPFSPLPDGRYPLSFGPGLQSGADHIIGFQCANGGWGWPHTACPTTTYNNITAPIAMGLLHAYSYTSDPDHLAAAVDGGDYDLTFTYPNLEYRLSAFTAAFLHTLSGVTSNPAYSSHAATEFFDELTAKTYGPSDLDTAAWIAALQAARSGSLINLRPWDLHTLPWVAGAIGNADSTTPADGISQQTKFRDAVLDGLNTLDQSINPATDFGDLIGLAGGVRGLALNGTTSFAAISSPQHPDINGITTLCALADVLAGYQNADGSWYWHSDLAAPGETDKDVQTSAYAVMALVEAAAHSCGPYSTETASGRHWIRGMQLPDGGFLSYPLGDENIEVEAEALNAIEPDTCTDDVLEFKLASGSQCVQPAETVTVELHQSDLQQLVNGFQAFAQFDSAALAFVSGTYTVAPYPLAILTPITAAGDNINMSAGILPGGMSTMADAHLVTLTFTPVGPEGLTVVSFRTNAPPNQFTDTIGGAVEPCLRESPSIVIDGTDPVITCPPDVTIECDESDLPANTGTATATDNLDESPSVTYSDSVAGGACPQERVITRTWTATDCAGNSAVCVQTITVDDSTDPSMVCPADVTIECDESTDPSNTGTPTYLQGFEDPGFVSNTQPDWNDYHSDVTRVASGTNGIPSKTGGFHATIDSTSLPAPPNDFSGAFTRLGGYTSSFGGGFITSLDVYMDLGDPAVAADTYGWDLSCAVNNQAGSHRRDFIFHTAGSPGQILVGGSNNSNFTRRNDLASINHYVISATGWYTFQWVFRDNGGVLAVDLNLRNAAGTLLWTETRSDPSDLIATVVGGNRYMWFTFLEVDEIAIDNTTLTKVVDNCDETPAVSYSDSSSGTCPTVITRTWTAADDCGNDSSCAQTITVQDTTDPVITCPGDTTIECDESDLPANTGSASATDNCDGSPTIGYSDSVAPGACLHERVITRTWTATDDCGNDATCVQVITVEDTTDPIITCPGDVTIECDESDLPANTGSASATDNCDGSPAIGYSDSVAAGACAQERVITRTWTATDDCGNDSTCVQIITVDDSTDPLITFCPADVTISCHESTIPGVPYGTVSGGVMVYYNSALPETPANQAYYKAQYSQTNANGAAFSFSTAPLTGSGLTWALLYGQVPAVMQFGFDFALETPTATIPTPYLTAYENTNNTIPGRAPAGSVRWAINDYKFNVGGPADPSNAVINSLIRSATPPNVNPLVDIEILQLDLVSAPPIYTQTIAGVLHSDGLHHWYHPAQPDSPLSNFNLNGDFYFSGTLVYDTTLDVTAGGDFYAGTIAITANSPNVALGFALAVDNCDAFPVVSYSDDTSGLTGCNGTGTIIRTWTATDACGNSSSCVQTITVVDTTDPEITCPADVTIECDESDLPANTGSASAVDNCDPAPAVTYGDSSAGTCPTTITRTWTATDDCGNDASCVQSITVEDTTDPMMTCPANITVPADAGGCDAVVTYTTPTATDNCDPAPTVVCVPPSGSTFSGTTTVTCTATDDCGNDSQCTFDVTVDPVNELVVTVQLSPTMAAGPFTRCITFEAWDCPGASPSDTVDAVLSFSGGVATATVDLACGTYTCLTARDKRHTLRRRDEAFGIIGTQYVGDFTGNPSPPVNGDWLIGGNLNDDFFIDILDFGVFTSQWLVNYGSGNTNCSTAFPHADINGDGVVNNFEFSFIQINFLKGHEANCCGAPGAVASVEDDGPVERISVQELVRQGKGELAAGDLNGDGWLDAADIEAFAQGVRPEPGSAQPGPAEAKAGRIGVRR